MALKLSITVPDSSPTATCRVEFTSPDGTETYSASVSGPVGADLTTAEYARKLHRALIASWPSLITTANGASA